MALIVEDGTGVIGANSYVSLAEVLTYAAQRNYVFDDETHVEGFAIDAKDYLESFRGSYSGKKTTATNALQWPRVGVTIDGEPFPDDAIPQELKDAQCQLAMDSAEFGGLNPSTDGYAVSSEKIDVIEVQYAAGGRLSGTTLPATPQYIKAQALIDPLLASGSFISTVRV